MMNILHVDMFNSEFWKNLFLSVDEHSLFTSFMRKKMIQSFGHDFDLISPQKSVAHVFT